MDKERIIICIKNICLSDTLKHPINATQRIQTTMDRLSDLKGQRSPQTVVHF